MKESVEVVLFDDGPFRLALEEAGVAVDVLDAPALRGISKRGGRSLPKARTLSGIVSLVRETAKRARHVDVIYANTPRTMLVGALAGMAARRPVVWHLHQEGGADPLGRVQRFALKWCARVALDRAIADSVSSKHAFEALAKGSRLHIDVVEQAAPAQSGADAPKRPSGAPGRQTESVSAILAQAAMRGAR